MLYQVSEDNEKIRRNPDLPVPEFNKERNEDLKARSLYAVSGIASGQGVTVLSRVEKK